MINRQRNKKNTEDYFERIKKKNKQKNAYLLVHVQFSKH